MRGLNSPAKKKALREFADSTHPAMFCIQETKLACINTFTIMQCLGPSYDGFFYLPASDTRGWILLAWNSMLVSITNCVRDTHCVTWYVTPVDGTPWWLTTVYGPQEDNDKMLFLEELAARRELCPGAWMVIGDFNMILQASDKSNSHLDRRMMRKFRQFVDGNGLKELYMHGRAFTWSNEREVPTLTKIDKALVSVDWEIDYPDCLLQAMSTSASDHCPLHLALNENIHPQRRFRFEVFWTRLEGFDDAVKEAWVCDPNIHDPFKRLDALLRNAARYLTAWGQRKVGNVKLQIAMANSIIFQLDVAQERRLLSVGEIWLRRTLKLVALGLASLERTIARQRSRL